MEDGNIETGNRTIVEVALHDGSELATLQVYPPVSR